jgi:hypothetical protein
MDFLNGQAASHHSGPGSAACTYDIMPDNRLSIIIPSIRIEIIIL